MAELLSQAILPRKKNWLVERDLHSRSLRRGTSSTNLMPICLHLPLTDSSPLVSTKRWFFSRLSTATKYLVSKVLSAESLYGVLVFLCPQLKLFRGIVLHLTLLNVYRFKDNAKIYPFFLITK